MKHKRTSNRGESLSHAYTSTSDETSETSCQIGRPSVQMRHQPRYGTSTPSPSVKTTSTCPDACEAKQAAAPTVCGSFTGSIHSTSSCPRALSQLTWLSWVTATNRPVLQMATDR